MAIEDALAKLQSAVDELGVEVRQAISDLVGGHSAAPAPAPVEAAPVEAAPVEPAGPVEGANVAQQDIVPPAPTTEPPPVEESPDVAAG